MLDTLIIVIGRSGNASRSVSSVSPCVSFPYVFGEKVYLAERVHTRPQIWARVSTWACLSREKIDYCMWKWICSSRGLIPVGREGSRRRGEDSGTNVTLESTRDGPGPIPPGGIPNVICFGEKVISKRGLIWIRRGIRCSLVMRSAQADGAFIQARSLRNQVKFDMEGGRLHRIHSGFCCQLFRSCFQIIDGILLEKACRGFCLWAK